MSRQHVLDNEPALSLVLDLENRGADLEVDGQDLLVTPRSILTDSDIAQIRRHKATLIRLVQICDDGVQERVESFKRQKPSTAPVFEPGYRYVAGVCFSCGDRHLDRHKWGRCWRCFLALQLAWNLTIEPADLDTTGGDDAQSLATDPSRDEPEHSNHAHEGDTHRHESHNPTE